MNKIKIFLNPIEGREKYLNHIANEGYRLVKSGSIIHEFEKTNSNYRYAVEYIGYMSNKERKNYTEFLNSMNLKVFNSTSWLFVLRGCSLKKPIIRNRYKRNDQQRNPDN